MRSRQTPPARTNRRPAQATNEPTVNAPPPDNVEVLDTRHIHIRGAATPNAGNPDRTNPDVPTSGMIGDAANAGPIQSANLGDDGSLGDVGNIDTSATGPAGVPSIGNLDPAGTGNAGNAGLGNSGTALDAALNTPSTGMIGAPVTESLSTPGVGVMNASGAGTAGHAGMTHGGESDTAAIGPSGVGTADSGERQGRP